MSHAGLRPIVCKIIALLRYESIFSPYLTTYAHHTKPPDQQTAANQVTTCLETCKMQAQNQIKSKAPDSMNRRAPTTSKQATNFSSLILSLQVIQLLFFNHTCHNLLTSPAKRSPKSRIRKLIDQFHLIIKFKF